MAEPATTADIYALAASLAQDTADIRRETALETGDVRRDVAKAAFDVSTDVATGIDRSMANDTAYFIASTAAATQSAKEIARSQAWTEAKIDAGFVKVAGDQALATALATGATALESSRVQGALALGQALLGQQISADGAATRGLINSIRGDDLNRMLIERNALIVEERSEGRHWERGYNNGQFAAVSSQMNALASQFNDTKQGMVNFGTQTGVGQTSTSNNVH
jgi:hypothetical protein